MGSDGSKSAIFLIAGLLLLVAGALIPAHYRLIDRDLLEVAGTDSPGLVDSAREALSEERVGPARLMLETARSLDLPGASEALSEVESLAQQEPHLGIWGGPNEWLDRNVGASVPQPTGAPPPVLTWLLPEEVRVALANSLAASSHPAIVALLGCRALEQTAMFSPVSSASGAPFDSALLLAATLVETGRVHPLQMLEWERQAMSALQEEEPNRGFEAGLLELLAAARRLNWEQLATLMERCEDRNALQTLVAQAGEDGADWGPLLSAVILEGSAHRVAGFLDRHSSDGLDDLKAALGLGSGAVQELVQSGNRLHHARIRSAITQSLGGRGLAHRLARTAGRAPVFGLGLKYLLWLDGLFLVFAGLWYGRHACLEEANRRFEPRPDLLRLAVVTIAAAVLLFLISERLLVLPSPSATDRSAAAAFPVFQARLRFDIPQANTPVMNNQVLAMLGAFFVIQLAIYFVGLGRLRYIREKAVRRTVKLQLLDNEEAVFDAPLYVGIGGSVLALVMRLTGMEEISLMASYSSTLFGILFCFILKVMHVRPYRQRLILESAERKLA